MIDKDKINLIEIFDEKTWEVLLTKFDDANIYQTWNYNLIVNLEKKARYLAIYKNEELISICQVRIKTIPIINKGVAYIFRGPLVKKRGNSLDYNLLLEIFTILKEEFVLKQNLFLRIRPFVFIDHQTVNFFKFKSLFIKNNVIQPYRSIILDINKELSVIRAGFRRSWRQELNKAENNNIEIVSGSTKELFNVFLKIYNQMHKRKKFQEFVHVDRLGNLNDQLAPEFKQIIFIALKEKVPIAAFVGSAIGDTGIAISGGTNSLGIKYKAAYLLQWEMIKWLKAKGCINYDLGGVDQEKNPGGYVWKTGISKHEVKEFGIFDYCENKISKYIVKIGDLFTSIKK